MGTGRDMIPACAASQVWEAVLDAVESRSVRDKTAIQAAYLETLNPMESLVSLVSSELWTQSW